jgi:hypothetical protein
MQCWHLCWCYAGVWHHCQHCAVVIASAAPAWSPLSRRHHHPHCAGVVALIAPTLLPASQTGICPVTTQLQHLGVSGDVAMLLVIARGFVPVLGILPWQLCLQWSSQCSAGVSANVVLASLPPLRWCHCQHCAVVVAGVVPALLPLLRGHHCSCCTSVVDLVAPVLPPALQKLASTQSGCSCNTSALVALLPCS